MSNSPPHSQPQAVGFWPTIQQAINSGITTSEDGPMRPQCPICLEYLSVASFPPVPNRETMNGQGDPTRAEVLICGHIFCQACRATQVAHNGDSTCPVCRASLLCSQCGARSNAFPIPKDGEGSTNMVPELVPEGYEQAGRCPFCIAAHEFQDEVDKGEWPSGLDDMEPGFVNLFYHIVHKLFQQKRDVGKEAILGAITNIVDQEYDNLNEKRCISVALKASAHREENPWYMNIVKSDGHAQNLRSQLTQSSTAALARRSQPLQIGPTRPQNRVVASPPGPILTILPSPGERIPRPVHGHPAPATTPSGNSQVAECLDIMIARQQQLSFTQTRIIAIALTSVPWSTVHLVSHIGVLVRGQQLSDAQIGVLVKTLFEGLTNTSPLTIEAVVALVARRRLSPGQFGNITDDLVTVRWPDSARTKIQECIQALNFGRQPSNSQIAAVVSTLFAQEPDDDAQVAEESLEGVSER